MSFRPTRNDTNKFPKENEDNFSENYQNNEHDAQNTHEHKFYNKQNEDYNKDYNRGYDNDYRREPYNNRQDRPYNRDNRNYQSNYQSNNHSNYQNRYSSSYQKPDSSDSSREQSYNPTQKLYSRPVNTDGSYPQRTYDRTNDRTGFRPNREYSPRPYNSEFGQKDYSKDYQNSRNNSGDNFFSPKSFDNKYSRTDNENNENSYDSRSYDRPSYNKGREGYQNNYQNKPYQRDTRGDTREGYQNNYQRDAREGYQNNYQNNYQNKPYQPRPYQGRDNYQKNYEDRPFREGRTSRFHQNKENLFDLDKELLRLLFQRAELLQSVKRDNRIDPMLEKKLRTAWENGVARVTRDQRIARDFFNLLQQVEPIAPANGVPTYFNLAPQFTPVTIDLQGPVCARQMRMFLAIAAATGAHTIFQVVLSPSMMATIKAFNQLGGQLWWEGDGRVLSRGGMGLMHHVDKVIPVGNDAFSFYLVLALSLVIPSRLKFVGDGTLRFLDTRAIRQFLPQLNARMTSVIRGQDGIPVRTESAGMLPQTIDFTADLPSDFIISLIIASVARTDVQGQVYFNVTGHEDAERILSEVVSVLDELDIQNTAEIVENKLTISLTPCVPIFNENLQVELDPIMATTLLSIPAFVGGKTVLHGALNEAYDGHIEFLKSTGLSITVEDMMIIAENTGKPIQEPNYKLAPSYPFALIFTALNAHTDKASVKLPTLPENHVDVNEEIVSSFLAQIGLKVNEENILEKIEAETSPWFLPNTEWGLALSLAAFMRPHIRIVNPDMVSSLYPTFWRIYNTLPNPDLTLRDHSLDGEIGEENTRRRIIADVSDDAENETYKKNNNSYESIPYNDDPYYEKNSDLIADNKEE